MGEGHEIADDAGGGFGQGLGLLDGLGGVEAVAVEEPVQGLGRGDLFVGEARTLEPDGVDHLGLAGVAVRDHERRDVLHALRAGGDHRVVADAAELVDARVPANVHMVADVDVSGDGGVAGDDEVVADDAVMGDVRIGEEGVVIAEDGPFALLGAEVDADVFAEGVAGTDLEPGLTGAGFEVLRAATDDGIWKDFALRPELRVAFDRSVVVQDAASAQRDVRPNIGIGTDLHAGAELGAGLDDGGGMDQGAHPGFSLGRQNRRW